MDFAALDCLVLPLVLPMVTGAMRFIGETVTKHIYAKICKSSEFPKKTQNPAARIQHTCVHAQQTH